MTASPGVVRRPEDDLPDPELRPRNIDDILRHLSGVKPSGERHWLASCPCLGHATPAKHLSIEDAGDKALVSCHPKGKHEYPDFLKALGFDSLSYSPNGRQPESRIATTYDYTDEDGTLLFQVVRFNPKDFKQRRPDGHGDWLWNLKGVRRVLYHLPDLVTARAAGDTIYFVEGEKDADALWDIVLVATTSPAGAGKWRPEYADMLQGAHVVVIADKDTPGREHADEVAKSIQGKARTVKLLELPGDDTNDVSDWLANGGTAEDLQALVNAAPNYAPALPGMGMRPAIARLAEIASRPPTHDLIQDLFPDSPSAYGLLAGRSGIGKTYVALEMAFCLATGTPFLGRQTKQCKVGLLTLEGAEAKLGQRITTIATSYPGGLSNLFWEHVLPFRLIDSGIDQLAAFLDGLNFAMIDPLRPLVAGDYTSPKDASAFLVNLRKAQEKTGTAALLTHHIRKPDRRVKVHPEDLQFEVKGASEYVEAATSVLLMEKAPQERQANRFAPSSGNIALHFVKIKDAPTGDVPALLSFNPDLMLFQPVSNIEDDTNWSGQE